MRLVLALAILALLFAPGPGCSLGLNYDGDESGLRREEIKSSAGSLSYLAIGDHDAPRIIFIHGSPGKATAYAAYLQDPLDGFETVAVDRLGYGESRRSGGVPTFREQAAAIAPLLVERNGRWPILVGHSLGVPIAARLAAEHPGRVGGLVLIAGPLDPDLEKLRWYNTAASVPPVNWKLSEHLRVSNLEMYAARRQLMLLAPLLDRITCPVTVVHGTRDTLVPYRHAEFALRAFAASERLRIITLEGEDHFIPRTRPELVRKTILDTARGPAR